MHASGIRVDESAKAAFASASSDASALYVKYQIKNETFTKVGGFGSKQSTVDLNFQEIRRALNETKDEPAFLCSKYVSSEQGKWLLIFYMPEGCTVRDRMVYAASAGALKDGLGGSNFDSATYTVSKLLECTESDYRAVTRQMSHDDILTLDEKAKLDGETESHKQMSSTRSRAIVGLPIKASEEALNAMLAVQKGAQSNTVILALDGNAETVQVQQQGHMTWEQVQTKLPSNEPRYILQNFTHEHDGKQTSAFVFIYYCPDDIKAKLKMTYSTCKSMIVKMCEGLEIQLNRSIELSEIKELTTASILDELYPQVSAKKTFKKPARPGRGNARLIGDDGSSASSPKSAASSSPSP